MPDFESTKSGKGERECMKMCWLPVLVGDSQLIFPYKAVVGHTALKYGVAVYVTPKKDFGSQKSRKEALLAELLRGLVSPHLGSYHFISR